MEVVLRADERDGSISDNGEMVVFLSQTIEEDIAVLPREIRADLVTEDMVAAVVRELGRETIGGNGGGGKGPLGE